MMGDVVDANYIDFDELTRRMKSRELIQCPECFTYFIWNKLPDENVIQTGNGKLEFWGAPCEEMIVSGFVCPECGKHTEL
jgi:hypothetical protein